MWSAVYHLKIYWLACRWLDIDNLIAFENVFNILTGQKIR